MPEINYVPDPIPQQGKHYAFASGLIGGDSPILSGTGTPVAAPPVPSRDYHYFKDSDNTTWFWRGTAGATSWQQEA